MNELKKLRKLLTANNLDAVLVSSVPNIIYLTNYEGFSTDEREGFLLITKTNQYVITDARYGEAVRNLNDFTFCESTATTPLSTIIKTLAHTNGVQIVGFEEHNLTVAEYTKLQTVGISLKPVSLAALRIIKTPEEIITVQKACDLGDATFQYILPHLTEGITEKEIATKMELFMKEHGGDISFKPIVAFGANAAIPHHQTNNQILITNNFVLLDFGAKVANYCSDMTRTIFFGNPTTEQQKMYQTVYDAQQKAIEYLITNYESGNTVLGMDVDAIARDHIINQGYPNLPHSLGHGIGLAVHEAPRLSPNSKDVLQQGMVFSIEPGIYVPGFGGVRIEDLVVIKKDGITQLTNASKEFIQIS